VTASRAISPAGIAFDSIARSYDEIFTRSLIGRAQREAVWNVLSQLFHKGQRVLEINCGTGEDALFLAQQGVRVLACDASRTMIEVAQQKLQWAANGFNAEFKHLATEEIGSLAPATFDGVFSNFSGLNCIGNLSEVASQLGSLTQEGAPLAVCLSTRVCAWELVHFGIHLDFRRAVRRLSGLAVVSFDSHQVPVHYPTVSQIRKIFSPWFRLKTIRGIGVFVPPSYMESWARTNPTLLKRLQTLDSLLAGSPVLRITGDHVLLFFERLPS
jgi:ubiquinone/menaquinone biosynthesis C-methylase UbiE